jgi:hypothetical protein
MNEETVQNTETPMEQSQPDLTKPLDKETQVHEYEKKNFIDHINATNETVPENFKDAGSWFDSLKEAQKQFTQAKQENAELKQQLESVPEQPKVEEPAQPQLTDELRIPDPPAKPEPTTPNPEDFNSLYDNWSVEFASTGDFSEDTKKEIMAKTGFTDRMLNDYISGQKAKLREGYGKAAAKVGGMENLNNIFNWASENLSKDDLQAVNIGLGSSTYEVTLRGLEAMYKAATVNKRAEEPKRNENLTQVAASQQGIIPYQTQREFKAERNDPRFEIEPKFRDMVMARMSRTDWNTLPI